MNKIVFQLAGILLFPIALFSQNPVTSELKWTVSKTIDQLTNEEVVQAGVFISRGDTIDWVQSEGARTYTFIVTGTEGSWEDVGSNGQITFQIKRGGVTGSIWFRRETELLSIEMKLMKDGQVTRSLKFITESVGH